LKAWLPCKSLEFMPSKSNGGKGDEIKVGQREFAEK
jgi:hypothetical protein